MADYGLDPSVMQYVQGGGMPTGQPASMADPSQYGLDPSVLAGVQNGWAPQPLRTIVEDPNAPPAPPPPPPQSGPAQGLTPPSVLAGANGQQGSAGRLLHFGVDPSVAGAPSEIANQPDSVPSVTGGALQTDMPQVGAPPGLPVQTSPDQVIGTVNALTPKQVAATNKVYAAQQQQAAAFANSPEGLFQKADQEKRDLIAKQQQDLADTTAASVAQNDAIVKAKLASDARIAKQDQIDQAQRAKDAADTQQYAQQYAQQIKDAADFKVNTNRDVGVSGMIAIALSGIGDALSGVHGPNAALQIINKRIDDNIADQWAKKKSLGDAANATKGLIDVSRQKGIDDRQDQDVEKAAQLADAQRQIDLIAAQSANPKLKANAAAASTVIGGQIVDLTNSLANRKLEAQKVATDQANKVAERGIQWAGIKQNDVHFDKTLAETQREHDLQRQDKLDDLTKQYIAMGNKALADKAKELKTSGVFDPNTASPLIDASDPAAGPALLQAKQLDMKAAAATDPAQQAALAKQAADLRTNIGVQYGATIDDKDGKIHEKIDGSQRLLNTTQRIRDALEDGSITDRDTRAALKTEATNAFTAWAEANGVKASSREHEVYTEAIGALDAVSATNVNKGPLESSLKALDTGTQNLVGTLLRGKGIKAVDANGNPWTMTAEKPPQATTVSGKTSAETAAGAEPGVVTKTLGVDLRHPFTSPEARDPLNVENAADTGPSGLPREDDAKVLGLIKTYGKVSTDENNRVVGSIVNLVGDTGGDERKQAIANSVITRVKAESPILYQKVLDALPSERRKELTRFDLPPVVLDHVMGKK